jgi:hypothetical protein
VSEGTGADRAESPPRGYQASGGLVPVPDPTLLTTQNLLREIAALRELLQTQLEAISNRVDANTEDVLRWDVSIKDATGHLRDLMEQKISELRSVSEEKFEGIANQFIERDKRTDQLTVASATAVQAAFAAQKEAVSEQNKSNSLAITKSENSTLESLKQLRDLFQADSKATNDKINDLKSRIDRGEGSHSGGNAVWGYISVIVTIVISAAVLGVLIATKLH